MALTPNEESKVAAVKSAMPKRYNVTKPNGALNAVLTALGIEDGRVITEIEHTKQSVFLATALGAYLDKIGGNYAVIRPSVSVLDDIYRKLIRDIAWQKHNIIRIIRTVLGDFLGPSNGVNWDVFQIRAGEIVVQIRILATLDRTLEEATYLHDSDTGKSTAVGVNFLTDTTKKWIVNEWANFKLYDYVGTEFAITSNTATVLTVVGTPVAGPATVDVLEGDNTTRRHAITVDYTILQRAVDSYDGDYIVANELVLGSTVGDNIVILASDVQISDIESVILFVVKAAGIKVVFDTTGL